MICPKCGKQLPENINVNIKFCPLCGDSLFEAGKQYLIEIHCLGQREGENSVMMLFLDDKQMYEAKAGDVLRIVVDAGFHTFEFRQKIRSKAITILVTCGYVIKPYYNTLSGLIETNVNKIEDSEGGVSPAEQRNLGISKPVMVSEDGRRTFDVLLGDDDPEYEVRATSGLKRGILRLFSDRCEFTPEDQFKKDVVYYKNIEDVKRKMGVLYLQCAGNVHKIYSIPKDSYNDVMAFLTNRISKDQGLQ